MERRRRVPVWMAVLIIMFALPAAAFPALLSQLPETGEWNVFVWIYPIYVLAAGWLAWQCYGRRTEMTWILLFLMALTHVAIHVLVNQSY